MTIKNTLLLCFLKTQQVVLDIHFNASRPLPIALSAKARDLIKIPLASQRSQTQYVAQGAVMSINSTAFMHNTSFGYYYTSTSAGISSELQARHICLNITHKHSIDRMCHVLTHRNAFIIIHVSWNQWVWSLFSTIRDGFSCFH